MSMAATGSRGARSVINVTPLIDVLLVLLIIFMVIQPTVQRGLGALVPQPAKTRMVDPDPRTLVISVSGTPDAPAYAMNGEAIALADLGPAMERIVQQNARHVLFVRGTAGVDYSAVTSVLNLAHSVGADEIGILTPATLAQ